MPTVSAYRNGSTAGMAGGNPHPAKRGQVTGWSPGAVRRHTKWLYSVDSASLGGVGYAVTLTMRDTPRDADELHSMRRAWIKRIERMGASRVHWVIEWQRRGTPHIHAAVYFPDEVVAAEPLTYALLLIHWTGVADDLVGANLNAQHYDVIDGPLGWLKYLSKHAARGVAHYQRAGRPAGWERTGRLWGHGGAWPVDEPMRWDMSREAYWRYRRLCRAWRVADARASGKPERIKYARRMLACPLPKLSAVRGVSDWIPEAVSVAFVTLLISEGFDVTEKVA